jgi:MOSC domain-containing protein YiiM
VLAEEAWRAACDAAGAELPWTTRRANLLVRGLDLAETIGRRLAVADVVLEITEETDPCQRMEDAHAGLRAALEPDWRGGVRCRVLTPGRIRAGDAVRLVDAD